MLKRQLEWHVLKFFKNQVVNPKVRVKTKLNEMKDIFIYFQFKESDQKDRRTWGPTGKSFCTFSTAITKKVSKFRKMYWSNLLVFSLFSNVNGATRICYREKII